MEEDREFTPEENLLLPKKPFYKRAWFWIVVVIFVGGIASASGGKSKDEGISKSAVMQSGAGNQVAAGKENEKKPAVINDTETAKNDAQAGKTDEKKQEQSTVETVDGVNPDLKAFLASYESFIDEYVLFMRNYMANPRNVLSMISEYTEMLEKMDDFDEKMEKYDTDRMSDADMKYYLEVYNRCTQKMLAIYSN